MTNDTANGAAFDVVTRRESECTTLIVTGELDVATSPVLRHQLHGALDDGASAIVVDLSATTFIDSSGLGVLVGALKRLREVDVDQTLVLKGLRDPVRKVFDITGLTAVFTILD